MSYLVNLTDDQKRLLVSWGHTIHSNGVCYYNLPQWYKQLEGNSFEVLDAVEMPKDFHLFVFEEMINLLNFIQQEQLIGESIGGTGMYEEPIERILEMYLTRPKYLDEWIKNLNK